MNTISSIEVETMAYLDCRTGIRRAQSYGYDEAARRRAKRRASRCYRQRQHRKLVGMRPAADRALWARAKLDLWRDRENTKLRRKRAKEERKRQRFEKRYGGKLVD